jgi:small redox-active disulfide protein 2
MRIQVFGTGCAACETLRANVSKAVAEMGLECRVELESRILEMVKAGVAQVPALVVDGEIKSMGQALDVASVKRMLGAR